MNLKQLQELEPWEWPSNAGATFLKTLQDVKADPNDRVLAAELAGESTVINDELAAALLSVVADRREPEPLRAKAAIGWQRMLERNLPRAPVLAADTTVALEGRIFGKPTDRREAGEMLAALSGKRHEVLTAVALQQDDEVETALSVSEVQFRGLSAEEIHDYVATGESDDKAGAYAIQGRAALFVTEIRGSQSGIVGLPLYETAQLLQKMSGRRERRSPR